MARKGSTQLPEYTPHAGTTPPPEPDLLEQLSFEHRQIQRLWSELQLSHRRHIEARAESRVGLTGQRELSRQLLDILGRHEATELQMLYPKAAAVMGEVWVNHATSDHADARDLLGEVEGESPEDAGVFDIFTDVLTKILAHIDEEESIIFPMLRAAVPAEDLNAVPHAPAIDVPVAEPEPPVIDIAAAEREATAAGDGESTEGSENGGNGTSGRGRFKLRRR